MWFRIAMLDLVRHHPVVPPMHQQDERLGLGEIGRFS
jgi:hypothetical protein